MAYISLEHVVKRYQMGEVVITAETAYEIAGSVTITIG